MPLSRRRRTAQRAVPTIWLNLVCLDAPVVAVAWLCLFARTFHVSIQIENAIALFLTAWLIYLADRLADSLLLEPGTPRSARHAYCLRHREIWIATVVLVAGLDSYVIWRGTAIETFFAGAVVGLLAIIYLVLNHPFGRIWRSLPAKELAIGVLFCAGTMVALQPHLPLTPDFVLAVIFFAALCSLNCVSIASWERDLDRAQGKVSIATRHPGMVRVAPLCLGLAGVSLVFAFVCRSAAALFACLSASALLLGYLNASRSFEAVVATALSRRKHAFVRRQSAVVTTSDQRTALADLVLLTPVVALILAAL
ncbi:MAG: hypothetical protein WAO00_16190 [Chthoniobacterales bacterium]